MAVTTNLINSYQFWENKLQPCLFKSPNPIKFKQSTAVSKPGFSSPTHNPNYIHLYFSPSIFPFASPSTQSPEAVNLLFSIYITVHHFVTWLCLKKLNIIFEHFDTVGGFQNLGKLF